MATWRLSLCALLLALPACGDSAGPADLGGADVRDMADLGAGPDAAVSRDSGSPDLGGAVDRALPDVAAAMDTGTAPDAPHKADHGAPPDQNPPDQPPPDQNPPDQNPPDQNPPDQYPPDQNPPDQNPRDTHAAPDAAAGADAGCSGSTWALFAGGSGFDYAHDLAVDSAGNSYVVGSFSGAATFGTRALTSAGGNDAFVAKVSPGGAVVWAVSAGGSAADAATGVAVDSGGNVYITGTFNGTATFGSVTLTTLGTNDIFVAKLNPAGAFVWALFTQGTTKDVIPRVAVDASGQAHITGHITARAAANGSGFVWTNYLSGVPADIVLDSQGTSVIAGYFSGTATFGSTTLTAASAGDVFVAWVNGAGKVTGVVRGSGQSGGFASAHAVALDSAGGLALAGAYRGTYSFGATQLSSKGGAQKDDVFVARLGKGGTFLWAASAGGTGGDLANAVALTPQGQVLVAGAFSQSASFGSTTLQASGAGSKSDLFWATLSASGSFVGATGAGGSDADLAVGRAVAPGGSSRLLGVFQGTATFGTLSQTTRGSYDVVLARLNPCGGL